MNNQLVILVLIAAGINYLPRLLGYILARKIDLDHPVFQLMEYIAYAIIAALSIRLIFLPSNALRYFSLELRVIVCVLAILFYLKARKYLFLTLVTAMVILVIVDGWNTGNWLE